MALSPAAATLVAKPGDLGVVAFSFLLPGYLSQSKTRKGCGFLRSPFYYPGVEGLAQKLAHNLTRSRERSIQRCYI